MTTSDDPLTVVMTAWLNPDGRGPHDDYLAAAAPLLAEVGAERVYGGEAMAPLYGRATWSRVIVTRFPSRAALMRLVTDPRFAALAEQRDAAVARVSATICRSL